MAHYLFLFVVYFTTLSQWLDFIASVIGWQMNEDECTRTNIHALSGIRAHGLNVQAIKAYVSDRAATGTSVLL
jgi:hypothetical protein